jgi:transposase
MAHGINANIVHGWRKLAREVLKPVPPAATFVPVRIAPGPADAPTLAQSPTPCIDIELRRGPLSVHVAWPLSAAGELSGWLREVLR